MGKSNRIKRNKENEKVMSLNDYSKVKGKKGMPNWAVNVIAIVVALAILTSVVFIALASTGIVMRIRTAMSSDNYRVSGNMMKYYFQTTYQNFATNYESYMTYLSLDTSKPLKAQIIGDTSTNANALDVSIVGSQYEGKTWFDYFMEQTQSEVRTMLYYCEEANKNGVELDEEDMHVIDHTIDDIRTTAASYGYTLNAYIANAYGKGISETDVRAAMELSSLSSKVMTKISQTLNDAIGADRIDSEYNENKSNFDLVDYTYYTFRVNYSDVQAEVKEANENATDAEILEAYKKAIADAKKKAEELLTKKKSDDFEKYYLAYVASDEFDGELESASKNLSQNKPTDEQMNTIRDAMADALVEEVMAEKAEGAAASVKTDDKYTVYGVEVTEAWAKAFDTVKTAIFDTLTKGQSVYIKDGVSYSEHDTFLTWAFKPERKANETHKIYTGDGSEEGKEITATGDKYFYASVYLLRNTQYRNDEKARDVAYMLFSSTTAANAAIEALKAEGTVTLDVFNRIADEKGASSHTVYEDYIKGDLGSTDLDKWLYDSTTTVGSYTAKAITLQEGTVGVFFYAADGEEAWRVNVKTSLLNEDFSAYTAELENTYSATIKVKDKVCAKVAD